MKFFRRNYYFLISSLQELVLEEVPEISFLEIRETLLLNLSQEDLKQVERLLHLFDLRNIRAFWLKQPLDPWSQWDTKDLEEELLVRGDLPAYMVDYLERYTSLEDRLRYFASLYVSLYREEAPLWGGFLSRLYAWEREVRLILTALRSKYFQRDIVQELQFEDLSDPLVVQILAQKDSLEYIPPQEFEPLKALFYNHLSEPLKLEKALLRYRFDQIEDMEGGAPFSMDRILGYIARLRIVEAYHALKQQEDVRALFAS